MATMTETQLDEAIDLTMKLHSEPAKRAEVLLTLAGCDYDTLQVLINAMKANLNINNAFDKVMATEPAKVPVPAFVPPKGTYQVAGKQVQIKIGKASGLPYFVVNGGYAGALGKPSNAWAMDALSTPEKAEAALVAYAKETGKCGICGKTLTDPESVTAGIGPVCKKNLYGKK